MQTSVSHSMSRTRNYHQETIGTIGRFFEVLDILVEERKIKSINSFCEHYAIDKRNLYAQREDVRRGYFEVAWVTFLVRDYKASARYLLLGKGKMFSA